MKNNFSMKKKKQKLSNKKNLLKRTIEFMNKK